MSISIKLFDRDGNLLILLDLRKQKLAKSPSEMQERGIVRAFHSSQQFSAMKRLSGEICHHHIALYSQYCNMQMGTTKNMLSHYSTSVCDLLIWQPAGCDVCGVQQLQPWSFRSAAVLCSSVRVKRCCDRAQRRRCN